MWGAWMPVGLLLLVTKRYAKKHWNWMHLLHAVLGYFTLVVTLVWSFKIIDYFSWKISAEVHTAFGLSAAILCIIVALSGSCTAGLMQFYREKDWTPKEKVTYAGKFHRITGYFMLFLGNVTIVTGVWEYYAETLLNNTMAPIGLVSLFIFCLLVMIFEFFYRMTNRKAIMVVKTPNIDDDPSKRTNNVMVYTSE